uniref:(northern house mosquito) hypothetical protein n=1 Tax=Culex pipiens TaxID=7175 RepID=A0A8D8BDC2_CULPI
MTMFRVASVGGHRGWCIVRGHRSRSTVMWRHALRWQRSARRTRVVATPLGPRWTTGHSSPLDRCHRGSVGRLSCVELLPRRRSLVVAATALVAAHLMIRGRRSVVVSSTVVA